MSLLFIFRRFAIIIYALRYDAAAAMPTIIFATLLFTLFTSYMLAFMLMPLLLPLRRLCYDIFSPLALYKRASTFRCQRRRFRCFQPRCYCLPLFLLFSLDTPYISLLRFRCRCHYFFAATPRR